MMVKILYSLSLLTFVAVPSFYKSTRPSMLVFYRGMMTRHAWRVMYTRMILLFLFVLHFHYLSIFQSALDLLPSSVLCLLLFRHSSFERVIRFMQDRRVLWSVMMLSLFCIFFPLFKPLGYTIGVLIAGAVYYPSVFSRELFLYWQLHRKTAADEEKEVPASLLADWYFTWEMSELKQPMPEELDEEISQENRQDNFQQTSHPTSQETPSEVLLSSSSDETKTSCKN